ncbi:MAG: hypothetical protein UDR60_05945 [Catenibacterium mitsuokai]|nr:hypothetical protein [Catenibacterium mitsuokai]MEE0334447.1 hypothetical protein [Catenibacterium mitsuokai]
MKLMMIFYSYGHINVADIIGEEKIKDCMSHSQYQKALQLLELIDNKELKKECLLQRAKQVRSANARHYLIAASKEY